MATTKQTFTGTGSQTAFTIAFSYRTTADVKATINAVATTAFSVSSSTVTFNTAPANSAAIVIYRETNNDTIEADFQSGSALRAVDLNENFEQLLFVTQEATDDATSAKSEAAIASTNATAAAASATSAQTSATSAQTSATAAASDAATASTNATNAVTTANTANTTANTANTTANTAATNAETAVATANAASTTATTALNNSRESDGSGGFNTAISIANTASTNATNSVNTANTASTNASNAVTTANTAASNASTALSTANTASTNATTAVSTANTANTNATAAQSAASTAASNATSAQTSATAAQTSATAAQNSATAAQTSAAASANVADAFTATGTPATALSVDVPIDAANGVKLPTNANSYDQEGAIRYNTTLDKIEIRKGSGWNTAAGGATVSATPPTLASSGDVWYDHDNGRAYVYYNDGDSNQWVEMNPSWNGYVADNSVTSAKIVDGTIVNADINDSTSIDGTKINPNFGSQNVLTTGNGTFSGSVQAGGNAQSGTAVGSRLNSYGAVHAARTNDSDVVWAGYKVGNSTPTSQMTADGSATFAGDLEFTSSSSSATQQVLFSDGTSGRGKIIYRHNGDSLAFETFSSEAMRVTSAGRLLVGTTETSVHPDRLIEIGNTSRSGTYQAITTSSSGIGGIVFADTVTNDTGGYRGLIQYFHADDAMVLKTSSVEALRITSDGKLGVGTTSASEKLTVAGHIDIPNVNSYIKGGGHNVLQVDSGKTYFYGGTSGVELRKADNSAYTITVDDSGNATFYGYVNCLRPAADGYSYLGIGPGGTNEKAMFVNRSGEIDLELYSNAGSSPTVSINSNGSATFNGVVTLDNNLDMQDSDKIMLGTGDDLELFHDGANSFIYNNTGPLFIDQNVNDGDINIRSDNGSGGTTTYIQADGSSGAVKLYHYGTQKFETKSDGVDISGKLTIDNATNAYIIQNRTNCQSIIGPSGPNESDGVLVGSVTNSPFIFWVNSGDKGRIDSSGRLMLGTSTEAPNAHVTVRAASPQLSLYATPGNNSIITLGDTDDWNIGQIVYENSNNSMHFSTNNATRMSITSSGAMQMGDPSTSGNGGWSVFASDSGTDNQRGRMIFYAKSTSGNTQEIIQIYQGTTERLRIRADGGVYNSTDTYGALSDAKLKENIVDASSQWSDIKALQVRNFNLIEGQTHTQIGLIAQEVETVSPGLVSDQPDKDEDGNDLGTVTKAVKYSVLYMKAVKALQEAMDRIETLETKVAQLEANN